MKANKSFVVLAASLLTFSASNLGAQSLVEFGALYGNAHDSIPTAVIDSYGDPLGENLAGVNLWFLCLDEDADDPSNMPPYQWEYSLSTSSSILTSGVWSGITDVAARESIIDGITNMFFNNSAAIYDDKISDGSSYNTAGSAMQLATWEIINGYGTTWSGVLDETNIDAIILSNPATSGSLTEDFLRSSLIANPNANGRIFFGEAAGETPGDFQSVLLFAPYAIPEPSGTKSY